MINIKDTLSISSNKCLVSIYKRTRHDSITDYEMINTSKISNSESHIDTIDLTFNEHETIGSIAKAVKTTIKTSSFQIHIYFNEETNNLERPSPYRLSNGILLWCDPPKKIGQPDLSYIGFLSKSSKGWAGSIPHEVKLSHLNKKNPNETLKLIVIVGFDN